MVTLRELDGKGQDVRAWCWHCARGNRIDSIIWQHFARHGWDDNLSAAAAHFRCKGCKSAADVQLFPARRPPLPPLVEDPSTYVVATMFHAMRAMRKRR